jgi:hypothetical protein
MVGSELAELDLELKRAKKSPSPHGRVGTVRHLTNPLLERGVAVPSWSGRNRGKFWGFDSETKGNGKGVAVDLRLPENP